jgi:hypothetical protein
MTDRHVHRHTHHHHHSSEARFEVMRRLDALEDKIDLVIEGTETIMATLEELTGVLADIGTEVDKVSTDTDKLLADLAAIPTPGMTPEQQAAVDAAVVSATAIRDRLKALDDKVPDVTT